MGRRPLCDGDGYIETQIIFGLVTNPATVAAGLVALSEGEPFLLSDRFAVLSENSPALRLSSAGWINTTPASLVDIDSTEMLFELCKEKIIARTSPFSKRVRLFVERYLDFMKAQTEIYSLELEGDEIFTAEDWIFSTWLPMPHAQIQLPPEFSGDEPSFAEFDMAFWTGRQLIGIQVEQRNTMIKSKREKLDYLEGHHPQIKIISIPRDRLTENEEGFPHDLFDEAFSKFWQGLTLPHGPNPSPFLANPFRVPEG